MSICQFWYRLALVKHVDQKLGIRNKKRLQTKIKKDATNTHSHSCTNSHGAHDQFSRSAWPGKWLEWACLLCTMRHHWWYSHCCTLAGTSSRMPSCCCNCQRHRSLGRCSRHMGLPGNRPQSMNVLIHCVHRCGPWNPSALPGGSSTTTHYQCCGSLARCVRKFKK